MTGQLPAPPAAVLCTGLTAVARLSSLKEWLGRGDGAGKPVITAGPLKVL